MRKNNPQPGSMAANPGNGDNIREIRERNLETCLLNTAQGFLLPYMPGSVYRTTVTRTTDTTMKIVPAEPETPAYVQVMKCPVCGAERERVSNWKIRKVIKPPCRRCGSVLLPKDEIEQTTAAQNGNFAQKEP